MARVALINHSGQRRADELKVGDSLRPYTHGSYYSYVSHRANMRCMNIHRANIWCNGKHEGGVLPRARSSGNGAGEESEVRSRGLHQAAVL